MTLLFLYSVLTVLCAPVIYMWLGVRLYKGKEDKARFCERMGRSCKKRPAGKLVWMHGASVGECLSMLPLVNKIVEQDKNVHVMVTSGTKTSADLMARRLPPRAFHQYIPVDFPWAVKRFVKHWNADAVLWFESDFWPNILKEIHKTGKPLVLLNGRISDRSFARWQCHKGLISQMLKFFTMCFGQTKEDARRLKVLGAQEVRCAGNLKFAATTPVFNAKELNGLLKQIGSRPRTIAASTHSGEEEIFLDFLTSVKHTYPDFLLIIAPRHPHRGNEIEEMFKRGGFKVARRLRGDKIAPDTDLYLADTIGEMGIIYQLADLVFVGGSLVPFGGQNMLEPMRLKRAVFVGPHTFNFKEIVEQATQTGALIQVMMPAELLGNVVRFLAHEEELEPIKEKAEAFAQSQMGVLDRIYDALKERIDL